MFFFQLNKLGSVRVP